MEWSAAIEYHPLSTLLLLLKDSFPGLLFFLFMLSSVLKMWGKSCM